MKTLATVLFGGLLLVVLAVAWLSQVHIRAHWGRVEARLATAPPDPRLVEIILTVEGGRATGWVAHSLAAETRDGPRRNLERHLVAALWSAWLAAALDDAEIAALYAQFLPFEGGRGLAYGASRHFGKTPAELTVDEVLGLLAIARAPMRNAPDRAPDRYRQEVERLRQLAPRLDATAPGH